ncbi:MAG: aromatic amino acid transport family protein [Pseudomonadota bacterium]|nr:aromatic amino acid transport family protein [Pseudomonadota bacterium]
MLKPLHSAILLIAGTSVGAGMLALPIGMSQLGFIPSVLLMTWVWYIMYLSALLMLEVNLRFEPGTNIISMAGISFGIMGKLFAWTIYLLLLYVLNSAYLSALSDMMHRFLSNVISVKLGFPYAVIFISLVFLILIFYGATKVDKINRILMAGLALSFMALIYIFSPALGVTKLYPYSWLGINKALPLLATSFGFHIIIPSLRSYLDSDEVNLKRAILVGSLIPLVMYICWQMMVFATVPVYGPRGLIALWGTGKVSYLVSLLADTLGNPLLTVVINLFSFFIITTSFLGVSLSLFDFLVDGFKVKKTKLMRTYVALLTFLPPVIVVLADFKSFFLVLSFAGALVVLLLCLLPLSMAIVGRFRDRNYKNKLVGSIGIFLVSFFALSVILLETCTV